MPTFNEAKTTLRPIIDEALNKADAKFPGTKARLRPGFDNCLNDSATLIAGGVSPGPNPDPVPVPTPAPGGLKDLSKYHITLPIDKSGGITGTAAEIEGVDLARWNIPLNSQKFLRRDDRGIIMVCPFIGAKTSSKTKSTRLEFRGEGELEFSTDEHYAHTTRFQLLDPTKLGLKESDFPKLKPMRIGHLVYNAQFHAGGFPIVKIGTLCHISGFSIIAKVKHEAKEGAPDKTYELLANFRYDDEIIIKNEWSPAGEKKQSLIIGVNGKVTSIPMAYPVIKGCYQKWGLYPQATDGEGYVCAGRFFL